MTFNVGIESGSKFEYKWDSERQTFSYKITKDGKTVKPINTVIATHYERRKGKKITGLSVTTERQPILNFNEALTNFDYVFAIDTNYQNCRENKIAVACLVIGKIERQEGKFVGRREAIRCYEFWNPVINPEKFAWKKVIQDFQQSEKWGDKYKYALIVDSFLGEIPSYPIQHIPIADDFLLPNNWSMFYASSDVNEYFGSDMLRLADKEAKKALKELAQYYSDEPSPTSSDYEGCTFLRVWDKHKDVKS